MVFNRGIRKLDLGGIPMTKGISIHIGLNQVDPDAYDGWDGKLSGCINDANSMKGIADELGYQSTTLIDAEATSSRVIEEIARASQNLSSGDILLLTYSGHGGQVQDVNGDEDDGQDETWVLYDRMLVDDELYSLWSQFGSGVRIFVLSDSCHSGTILKTTAYKSLYSLPAKVRGVGLSNGQAPSFKAIPTNIQNSVYLNHQVMYNTVQWAAGRGDRSIVSASILLISGCQDNQLSADGDGNGLFTEKLLEVWGEDTCTTYEQFWKEIARRMPFSQSPNYFKAGVPDPVFEQQKPFTIEGGGDSSQTPTGQPSVKGPLSWSRDSEESPSFIVSTGSNRYYIFEATTRPELFDITNHGQERTDQNFYGTWQDHNLPSRLTATNFPLPQDAWERLRNAGRIYYRIGTTSSTTGWDNYQVSTGDSDGQMAPSITITEGADSGTPSSPGSSGQTLRYPSGEIFEVVDFTDVDDGIDYSDPTADGRVPLIRVTGRLNSRVSTNFQVSEFLDDQNSHYARISPELVEKLQGIRDKAGAINVKSGYRYPSLNADVGGASRSRHISGEAVEIYSNTLSPLELAEIALQVMGCDIGLGLGPDYIGVDVRGTSATWVEPGAGLNGSDFQSWVDQTCQERNASPIHQKRQVMAKSA
jgi:metacaspase-1